MTHQELEFSFNDLYDKHKASVYGYICYLTRNKTEAEDIFQETWLRVVQHFHRINNLHKARAWIFTIATNLYRDHLRKKRSWHSFWKVQVAHRSSVNQTGWLNSSNPETASEQEETHLAIMRAVDSLPENLRCIFILKEIEGFNYPEICDILNLPEGTAKSRMHRAVKKLRQELAALNAASRAYVRGSA